MNRRKFFRNGSLFTIGATLFNPFDTQANKPIVTTYIKNKKAKNIIIIVSDGMSTGTLNMADLYLNRKNGVGSNWLQLYKDNKVSRALMDMASASSLVTDSAAASSSWGSGFRVNNGSLNIGTNGEEYLPLWQKFKKAGKMAGCVTTVPITHATPAGFCIAAKSRNSQEAIAEMYADLKFDIMMGGGNNYFAPDMRKDKKDVYQEYISKGYTVVKTKAEMMNCGNEKPILGVFNNDGLPYTIDHQSNNVHQQSIPTLAEMTTRAIDKMKNHPAGFVLQVEAGKVDWAAHANDIAGLIHDQIAHDEAIKVAIDFAEKDNNTLVIITTDHGNANPGIIYGKQANANFDTIKQYTQTNDWILNGMGKETTLQNAKERIELATKMVLKDDEIKELLSYYTNIKTDDSGWYNSRHLPFKALAEMQKRYNSIGWISMEHSADYTELAMFGPGSHLLKPFIKNTDLHHLMLAAAEVENRF